MPRLSKELVAEREAFVRECRDRGMDFDKCQKALADKYNGMKMAPPRLLEILAEKATAAPVAPTVRKPQSTPTFKEELAALPPLPHGALAMETPAPEPVKPIAVKPRWEVDIEDPRINALMRESRAKYGRKLHIIDLTTR